MFEYSDTNKRYHTQNFHFKQLFGCKVVKVSLNGNFTCPNIDGAKGFGGCTYCSSLGSGDFGGNKMLPLSQQFDEIKASLSAKWNAPKYIAYFQANTNTYAPVARLKELFEEALSFKDVVGISIATRADCLDDDIIDYLIDINKRTYLCVELGLQTIHDYTGQIINRCHSYADFIEGFTKLNANGISVCVHLINGLPHEDKNMMLENVKVISHLPIQAVKLHLLHVIAGTKIAKQYENGEFETLTFEEYVDIICDQIELLPQEIVVERITGDGDKQSLIAPLWSLDKRKVLNAIDKELARRNAYQGDKFIK